ncbi:MAG: hypothetical protein RDV41_14690, partial [Planctomycetota bacterium]|nr:hypothetical protein [Planctomycetota bacterium]
VDKTVRLWDLESGKEIVRFDGHTGSVRGVRFGKTMSSASGPGFTVFSASTDGTFREWRFDTMQNGREVRRLDKVEGELIFGRRTVDGWIALEVED